MTRIFRRIAWTSLVFVLCGMSTPAVALDACGTLSDEVFSNGFGVGPTIVAGTETIYPPVGTVAILPDEHSSFLPPTTAGGPYTFFEAARIGRNGAVVLQTIDFQSFTLAPGYSSPVLDSAISFTQCAADVGNPPGLDAEFDENYAAPGSVLQDPTLPAGNLMMIYEGENHCRVDKMGTFHNVQFYYATAGFARSSDNGVTWAMPSVAPSATRYPILSGPGVKPGYDPNNLSAVGDAIPSAFVAGSCLYVVYANHPKPGDTDTRDAIQIARAQLGGVDPLIFHKYLAANGAGGFTSPGILGTGTDVVPFTPVGAVSSEPICTGTQYQPGLSFNDVLQRYLMTMVCEVSSVPGQLAWFYSTATSLDLEDWTTPRMIANTQSASVTPCPNDMTGVQFDGWYPSVYSLTQNPGHTEGTNIAFYLDGCNLDIHRTFSSRPVAVTPDPG